MRTNVENGLTGIHDAMVATFKEAMPWLTTVDAYKPLGGGEAVRSPAVLIEVGEMQPGRRVSNGLTPVEVEFAAHCILSVKTSRVELEVRNFAAMVIQIVDGNRWGLGDDNVERPTELSAFPGMFKPDEKGFESWVVNWRQTVHLGCITPEPDYLPADVWIGEAPHIGAAHEDDYERG